VKLKILAVVQHKGGVGKTTIAVNLAAGLADAGKAVLLIDLDPQGGASRYLNLEPPEDEPHLADVLNDAVGLSRATVPAEGIPRLAVVPGDLALSGLNLKDLPNRLSLILRKIRFLSDLRVRVRRIKGLRQSEVIDKQSPWILDAVVIDTPPGWGMLTVNALVAATDVIAPAELKPLSLMALVDLVGMIADVRKEYNPKLNPNPWVVPSKVERLRLTTECLEDLNATFPGKVLPTIRQSARVGESPGFHKPLSRYAPDSIGAEDFAALTKAVLKKVF